MMAALYCAAIGSSALCGCLVSQSLMPHQMASLQASASLTAVHVAQNTKAALLVAVDLLPGKKYHATGL
jgi:hypothetical protein